MGASFLYYLFMTITRKPLSEAHKAKLRKPKGPMSEEHKQKLRDAALHYHANRPARGNDPRLRGPGMPAAQKRKLSDAMKAYWKRRKAVSVALNAEGY